MNKFENVDIFASLGAIMRQNTAFYQSDFEIDKEIFQKSAKSRAGVFAIYETLLHSNQTSNISGSANGPAIGISPCAFP